MTCLRTIFTEEYAMVTLSRTSRRLAAVESAPPPRHGVAARPLAFLFTDLASSTALFERVGDIDACEIVREHFEFLNAIVLDHNGMVVKTTGDGVLAAFRSWIDAVRSALAVQTNITDFNRTHAAGDADRRVAIKLGVHAGRSVRLELQNGFDYFGSTVNLAARLRSESRDGDVVLSDVVAGHPGVRLLLAALPTREESLPLRGFDRPIRLVRVLPAACAGAARAQF
jgi:class 3 adenylate cyclase